MRLLAMLELLWRAHRVILVAIAVLLVANIGLYVYLENTLVPQVAERENHYIKRQAEVRQLMRNKGGLANTPEQLFILASQDLETFQQKVPTYQEFTGLIEELLVLSNDAGLNITQVSYKPERVKGNDLLRYNLVFTIAGRYEKIKQFIHAMEQSQRLLVIREISLQGADGGNVSLRLNLDTFFRPEGPA